MRRIVILVSICCIGAILLSSKCGSEVTAIEFSSSEENGTALTHRSLSSRPRISGNIMAELDTASWDGYEKPKTVKFNKLKGARLQGLDFALDKCLREMYGFELINPKRPRYGLFEFDDVERMRLSKNDTLYAIIAAAGPLGNKAWSPRYYMFWNGTDTISKDVLYLGQDGYPPHRRVKYNCRHIEGKNLRYSLGMLKDCLSTKLHGADSLSILPPRYWAPLEYMMEDPNNLISFAVKMIFRDGVVTRAWVTKFYNGGICILQKTIYN
ncbi:MAG: hypothetical protein K2M00_03050, partial [Muribaculaceae bacterium]|nr:hypothetical protein [Muribaculaceae bacterium]